MRKLLLAFLLLLPAGARATAYTASTNIGSAGNWNLASTWGGVGVPTNGDTVTIPTGKAVVCTDAETVGLNTDATFATNDFVVTGTGQFSITDGCVFSMRGNIQFDGTSSYKCTATSANATFQFIVPTALTFFFQWSNTVGSPFIMNISGSSPSALCIMTASLTGTGLATITNGGHLVNTAQTFKYAVFSNLGGPSLTVDLSNSNATVSPAINNILFDNDGTVVMNLGTKTLGFTWDAIDFRRCQDTANSSRCFQISGTGIAGTPRLITRMTTGSLPTLPKNIGVLMRDVQFGQSIAYGDAVNTPGYLAYNSPFSSGFTTAINVVCRMCFLVQDVGVNGANAYSPGTGAGNKIQDVIVFSQIQNQHQFVSAGAANTTANVYVGMICDANGMAWSDTGNCITDSFNYSVNNFICLNHTEPNANATTQVATWLNYTAFFCNIANMSQASATVWKDFRNNLMSYPATGSTTALGFEQAGFGNTDVGFARQSALSLDYNFFNMMGGSGDTMQVPGATLSAQACSTGICLLPNPTLSASNPSYMSVPTVIAPLQASAATTAGSTTATAITCSTCSFVINGLQAGDYICDATAVPTTCAPIANSAITATTLTLVSPGIATLNGTGHNITGRYGYMATAAQYYGSTSGYGTHDQHTNPQFIDATRSICTWYNKVSGAASECSGFLANQIPAASTSMIFTSTASTDTTHIFCSTCHFSSWGISTSTVVQVYSTTTTTIRGRSLVSAVTSDTELTLATAIASTASGDVFTFVTATQSIGYGLLATNGWDFGSGSGNGASTPVAVTPVTWSNPASALNYVRQGFVPMNGQLKNAAKPSDCTAGNAFTCDIGAVPVYPATAQVIF